MSENDNKDTHEGSLGTDRNPPNGTVQQQEKQLTDEELLKKRIEELRKRDPFIYRWFLPAKTNARLWRIVLIV